MKTLTTIAEVHALAFSREELISKEVITLSDILEAETRYVCPILGAELCQAIASGQYSSLRSDYVLPAVAAWCRYIVEPLLDRRCSDSCRAELSTAEYREHQSVLRSLRRKASTLSRRLSDHLNTSRGDYAEYNPKNNPLNHCSIYGDIIQIH